MKTENQVIAKPFLKWCGGKSKVIPQIQRYFPSAIEAGKITRYIEPFLGGGSMLLYILKTYPSIEEVIVNDINSDLIGLWEIVKNRVDDLIYALSRIEFDYLEYNEEENKRNFYDTIKQSFNHQRSIDPNYSYSLDCAVQFLFLNKTGFNGLYRVNQNGKFNVPYGKYIKPRICDPENLRTVSKLLNDRMVQFVCGSYERLEKLMNITSFTYFDPPYRPLSSSSNFTSYARSGFNDVGQVKLSEFFKRTQGYKMLSNSQTQDGFFEALYKDKFIHTIQAPRSINCQGNKRQPIDELLITNYNTR